MEDAAARYGRDQGADSDLALWAEARAAALQARDRAVAADASVEVRERVTPWSATSSRSAKIAALSLSS